MTTYPTDSYVDLAHRRVARSLELIRAQGRLIRKFDRRCLDLARRHVARSLELIRAQGELIRKLEQRGADAQPARALLSTMYRSLELMLEHRDAVAEAARSIARQNRRKGPRSGLRPLRLGTVAR